MTARTPCQRATGVAGPRVSTNATGQGSGPRLGSKITYIPKSPRAIDLANDGAHPLAYPVLVRKVVCPLQCGC